MLKKALCAFLGLILFWQGGLLYAQTPSALRVATSYVYPPFISSTAPGHPYGFDIDLMQAVCDELKTKCIFIQMPLTELLTNLENNNIDVVIGAISITPERKQRYEFTVPYYKSAMSYLGLSSANTITAENLSGKKIGVIKGSIFDSYLHDTYGDKVKVEKYYSLDNAMEDLSRNDIDLILIDTPVAEYWAAHSDNKFKVLYNVENNALADQGYGFMMRKGNYDLANSINNALVIIMGNGTYDKIRDKHFKQTT